MSRNKQPAQRRRQILQIMTFVGGAAVGGALIYSGIAPSSIILQGLLVLGSGLATTLTARYLMGTVFRPQAAPVLAQPEESEVTQRFSSSIMYDHLQSSQVESLPHFSVSLPSSVRRKTSSTHYSISFESFIKNPNLNSASQSSRAEEDKTTKLKK